MSESIQVTPLQQMKPGCVHDGQLLLPPEPPPDELPPDELLDPLPELLPELPPEPPDPLLDPPVASLEASEPPRGEVRPPQPSAATPVMIATRPDHADSEFILLGAIVGRRVVRVESAPRRRETPQRRWPPSTSSNHQASATGASAAPSTSPLLHEEDVFCPCAGYRTGMCVAHCGVRRTVVVVV